MLKKVEQIFPPPQDGPKERKSKAWNLGKDVLSLELVFSYLCYH